MRVALKDKKIDRMFLRNNGFIINSPDDAYYNQVKGRDITAFFEGDNLRRMFVEGNAESVYYALDDKKAYIGVNKMSCSTMVVNFGNNQVDNIRFYTQPESTMHPMKRIDHDSLKMKGFKWETKLRPKNAKDL
jgi:hypothetical protein